MRRTVVIVMVLGLLAMAVPALAVSAEQESSELALLYQEVLELRKQIVDVHVQQGDLTPEEGIVAKERLEEGYRTSQSRGFSILGGPGGCHGINGGGRGMMMGF